MNTSPNVPPSWSVFGGLCTIIFALAVVAFMIFVWGTIFQKAGYSFWMALLMIVPIVNLIWLLIFAFSEWPIQRDLNMLRGGRTGGFPVMPPGTPQ
jgi:hypothetical protein